MALALFDLDNTLIAGDSDHLWGDYLVEQGIVDPIHYKTTNDRFYQDYCDGRLDIHAYLRFSLRVLTQHEPEQLRQWHRAFMKEKVEPIMLPAARELLDKHRRQGDELVVITATNDFVTAPIVEALGVSTMIATRAERRGEHYTGDIVGIPCYREGKVERLREWLADANQTLDGSWFYSDSHNDLPLLSQVSHPVAVDPDPTLDREARERGWPVISLR
jgi:HAD superfamily hydrolase (TIGR01490 family)